MTHYELPCICSVEPPEPTKLSASTGRRSGWTDLITAFPVMLQGTRSAYRPEKLLRLYEYEASSECREVHKRARHALLLGKHR